MTDVRSSRAPATQDDGSEETSEPFSFIPSEPLDFMKLSQKKHSFFWLDIYDF